MIEETNLLDLLIYYDLIGFICKYLDYCIFTVIIL